MKQTKNNLPAVPAPSLSSGDDQAAAKQLSKLFADAQNGMRRIIALGLFAWEIKEGRLKKKQFGAWLAAHCPKFVRIREDNGRIQVSSSLNSYMTLTEGVLESAGLTITKYLDQVTNTQNSGIGKGGSFLLVPEKKVPANLLDLRNKIFALVDGKTAKQLFLEFKQAEEDEDGNAKKKHGRLKGQGGKRALTLEEQLEARRESALEHAETFRELFTAYTHDFVLLPDEDIMAEIAELDRQRAARMAWLKHPITKRDPAAIEAMLKDEPIIA